MKRGLFLFSGLIALAFIGMQVRGADTPATGPATAPAMEPIRYERSGGFAGTHDVVEISKDGAVVVQGKLLASGKGQLTAEQMAKLATLFADWKELKANYPPPTGSADGFAIRIRYGTQEVSASDMNKELPASFKAVQGAIEDIARDAAKNNAGQK